MSMSPELRDRWATALEDPSRVQGTGALCKVDPADGTRRQCCLDVLIDLYREDHPEGSDGALEVTTDKRGTVSYEDGDYGPQAATLPHAVAAWAGVSYSPVIGDVPATTLNDAHFRTFPEIAALIRESEVR
jgi:hypothetical protein